MLAALSIGISESGYGAGGDRDVWLSGIGNSRVKMDECKGFVF